MLMGREADAVVRLSNANLALGGADSEAVELQNARDLDSDARVSCGEEEFEEEP